MIDRMLTTDYDGCGKCLVGVRRLSRKTDATSSPEKQRDQILSAVEAVGGHIIAWADDWEVSGATDPLTRPQLGPWLRGEMGPYSGIAGAAVDRIGRNQRDVLNTGYMIKDTGRILVTYGHDGPWNLDDPADEMRFSMEAFGAQMELRAIQRRNRESTVRAREAGQPKQQNSYGYRYVRLVPTGRVDHVEIDPVAAEIIREVAERILGDESGAITCATEAARLTRAGVLSPADHRAVMYGREPQGKPWGPKTVLNILTSEAALGYLMHHRRPVLDKNGNPIRLADPLWDRATHDALVAKTAPKESRDRAPSSVSLLAGCSFCGNCGQRLYIVANRRIGPSYGCTARVRGIPSSARCKPAPTMRVKDLDAAVEDAFLRDYGRVPLFRRQYDPGTGYAARTAQLEADRTRLRDDRQAGLYDSDEDAAWYRRHYAAKTREITELRKLPDRPAGMRWVASGQTVADQWRQAADDVARRELLSQYEIRVVLFPQRHGQRVWVHGLDPELESQARTDAAERDRVEKEAHLEAVEAANVYYAQVADVEDYITT